MFLDQNGFDTYAQTLHTIILHTPHTCVLYIVCCELRVLCLCVLFFFAGRQPAWAKHICNALQESSRVIFPRARGGNYDRSAGRYSCVPLSRTLRRWAHSHPQPCIEGDESIRHLCPRGALAESVSGHCHYTLEGDDRGECRQRCLMGLACCWGDRHSGRPPEHLGGAL